MFNFSPDVEKVLRESGWFPARSVQISQWIDPLVQVGYRPLPVAKRILENLGGLEITPPHNEANVFFPGKIVFDPVFAASSELDRVENWQKQYDIALFPLGESDPLFILLCSEDGRIFDARAEWLYFLGETIESALELLILARRRRIPYTKQRR